MRRTARPRLAVALVALGTALSGGCGPGEPPVVVADAVASADGEVVAPPRDARLAEAGWPEAAAWIDREAREGRPVVVNVFASWCGPCREEAPILNEAAAAHPEVAFLGIDHIDLRPKGEDFVREAAIAFPTLYDVGGEVARAVRSTGMPTTAFFDHTGRLVHTHVGPITAEQLAERLGELEDGARAARG